MSTTEALIDDLSRLLDSMPADGDNHTAQPIVTTTSEPPTGVYTVSPPLPTGQAKVIPLSDARAMADQRKAARDALTQEGIEAAREALALIRQTFAEQQADFDDAVRALPAVHRVIEHAEKLEASQQVAADWPKLNFTIVLDSTRQVPPPARPRAAAAAVIDLDTLANPEE